MAKRQAYQKVASYEAQRNQVKKIVLLYSGSIYTSVLIPWLKKAYKADVVALLVDIGQKVDFADLKKQAEKLGADKVVLVDAKEQFANEYLARAIKANTAYQGRYHMLTPLSRPLLARIAVATAENEGASAIAHGCSAQSNDQIRLEGVILALNSDMKIIAPLRDETLFKKEALVLAKKYKIAESEIAKGYSYDENLWGVSIIGGDLEKRNIPDRIEHILHLTTLPEKAPEVAQRITIDFTNGIPTALDGEKMDLVQLIKQLNSIGGKHGVGLLYTIEDMILGLKSRSIDEEPAAAILLEAHRELEKYVSSRAETEFKSHIDTKWIYLAYEGKWYDPLMSDLESFINNVNEKVTGTVCLRLYKGNIELLSLESPKNIFEKRLAVNTNAGVVNHRAIAGYIELSSLPMRLANRSEKTILLTIGQRTNKFKLLPQLRSLDKKRYKIYATYKTHKFLSAQGIDATLVNKIRFPNLKPNLIDLLAERRFDLIIRIPSSKHPTKREQLDSTYIEEKAREHGVPVATSLKDAENYLEEITSTLTQ